MVENGRNSPPLFKILSNSLVLKFNDEITFSENNLILLNLTKLCFCWKIGGLNFWKRKINFNTKEFQWILKFKRDFNHVKKEKKESRLLCMQILTFRMRIVARNWSMQILTFRMRSLRLLGLVKKWTMNMACFQLHDKKFTVDCHYRNVNNWKWCSWCI